MPLTTHRIDTDARPPEPARGPTGLVSVDGRTFPLRATRIAGRAEGGLAETRLVQEYANPYDQPLEVVYTMPLPVEGAVIGYTIHLGERTIRGEIRRREEARAQYRKALEEGRSAGLLEQERPDTFTQRLGSLPPGCDVKVEIEVLHPLRFEARESTSGGPEWEYRFPTVTGVRYVGEAGRVPDAAALEPPRADAAGTPVRLEMELVIADGELAATGPRSSSHEIRASAEEGTTRIALAGPARLDRDLVVRWRAAQATVGVRVSEGKGVGDDGGRYALVTITPPAAPEAVFARDLTILIDASGSMTGDPIHKAVLVAESLLNTLTRADRFELVAFANTTQDLTGGPLVASERNVARAVKQLRALRAGGGTEMGSALLHALTPLRAESQRQVVLLTDGQIGFEHMVIGHILDKLPRGARLHVAGIGAAPNRTLTRGASRAGRGAEILVGPGNDATEGARRLCRATAAPVLTEVSVRGSAVLGVAPERPADVFAGQPLLVAVELRAEGGTVEVEGSLAGSRETWRQRIALAPRETTETRSIPLGAFFGRERIEDAEMRLGAARGPELGAIEEEIATIALRHQIVSRATSLVAVAEDPTVDPTDPRRRERLAVEMPAGVSAEAVGYFGTELMIARASFVRGVIGHEFFGRIGSSEYEAASIEMCVPVDARYLEGRVVGIEGDLLVVEMEVPPTGLEIPGDGAEMAVHLESGAIVAARLVGARSTKAGKHEPGLTVRLALRLDGGLPAGEAALVVWTIGGEDWHMTLLPRPTSGSPGPQRT